VFGSSLTLLINLRPKHEQLFSYRRIISSISINYMLVIARDRLVFRLCLLYIDHKMTYLFVYQYRVLSIGDCI